MAYCQRCDSPGGFFGEARIDKYTGICGRCARQSEEEIFDGIESGELPAYPTSIHLSSEELCHLEIAATYHGRDTRYIQGRGRFIATSKKLYFLADHYTYSTSWNSVLQVIPAKRYNQLYLELERQKGTGYYTVPNLQLVILLFDMLTSTSKRQILLTQGNSRQQIPQHIKTAVWQRDQGRCIQCGSNQYLEYDHIIPLSKGGATSMNNLQLLCRKCNSQKGSRI
jgi:hypothetical protein